MTRRRERGLALAVAVLAVAAWVGVTSRPSLVASTCGADCVAAPTAPAVLRVLQLNMLHGFPDFAHLAEREDLIVEEITTVQADVVLLQEVPWTTATGALIADLGRRTGMTWAYRRANGNRRAIGFEEGDAILSRYMLRRVTSTELPWGDDFFEHRTAVAAVLDTSAGPVRVVSTHLSGSPQRVSAAQAQALRAFVEADALPAIVGGDFNARPDSPAIRSLAAAGWEDLAVIPGRDPQPTCCRDPEPGTAPLTERVDYLWLRGAGHRLLAERVLTDPWQVARCCTLAASDHAGLLAIVDMAGEPP